MVYAHVERNRKIVRAAWNYHIHPPVHHSPVYYPPAPAHDLVLHDHYHLEEGQSLPSHVDVNAYDEVNYHNHVGTTHCPSTIVGDDPPPPTPQPAPGPGAEFCNYGVQCTGIYAPGYTSTHHYIRTADYATCVNLDLACSFPDTPGQPACMAAYDMYHSANLAFWHGDWPAHIKKPDRSCWGGGGGFPPKEGA